MKFSRWPCLLRHSFISELEGDVKEPSTLLLEKKGKSNQLDKNQKETFSEK